MGNPKEQEKRSESIDLFFEIKDYLEKHSLSELFKVLSDVMECYEKD